MKEDQSWQGDYQPLRQHGEGAELQHDPPLGNAGILYRYNTCFVESPRCVKCGSSAPGTRSAAS